MLTTLFVLTLLICGTSLAGIFCEGSERLCKFISELSFALWLLWFLNLSLLTVLFASS